MAKNKLGVRVFLTLSAIAGVLVGVIWYFGVRRIGFEPAIGCMIAWLSSTFTNASGDDPTIE